MRFSPKLEEYRFVVGDYRSRPNDPFGVFFLPGPCGIALRAMAVDGTGTGWEHVSVSTDKRVPNWIEMCFIKDLFWDPDDCVVQFHPPRSNYVNNYSRALHLWRWTRGDFPQPPEVLVGFKELGTLA